MNKHFARPENSTDLVIQIGRLLQSPAKNPALVDVFCRSMPSTSLLPSGLRFSATVLSSSNLVILESVALRLLWENYDAVARS